MIAMTVAGQGGRYSLAHRRARKLGGVSGTVTARWIVDAVRVRLTRLQRLRPALRRAASVPRAFRVSEEMGTFGGARREPQWVFKTSVALVVGLSLRARSRDSEGSAGRNGKYMAMRRGGHLFWAFVVATTAKITLWVKEWRRRRPKGE